MIRCAGIAIVQKDREPSSGLGLQNAFPWILLSNVYHLFHGPSVHRQAVNPQMPAGIKPGQEKHSLFHPIETGIAGA
jgi:hypothetical protein